MATWPVPKNPGRGATLRSWPFQKSDHYLGDLAGLVRRDFHFLIDTLRQRFQIGASTTEAPPCPSAATKTASPTRPRSSWPPPASSPIIPEYLARVRRKDIEKHGVTPGCGYRTTRQVADYFDISLPVARALLNSLCGQGQPIMGRRDGNTLVWRAKTPAPPRD